ncbi:uncharacterized protein LOC144880606 [Branchiostoma floridae x Branchiostoma japonicum]
MLARSKSSIAEQLLYSECQRDDLESLSIIQQYDGLEMNNIMRYFTGDGPAQWIESGEQHMGTFGCSAGCGAEMERFVDLGHCLRKEVKTLEERRQLVTALPSGANRRNGGVCPFKNLKKHEIIQNLEASGLEYDISDNKKDLELLLKHHLQGVSHVPALCYGKQESSMAEINLEMYEVSPCETLHLTKEHIKNLLEELPHHLCQHDKDKMTDTLNTLQNDKEQLRGVDYRKHLLILTAVLFEHKANPKVIDLLSTLANVVHICYSLEKERTPRQVLRLANQVYLHSIHLREVIGTKTKVITSRKLYGTYFHSLSTHAPILYRLVNLRSLNAEQQERLFNKLKGIYSTTSSRRPAEDVGMGMLRMQAELHQDSKLESRAESEVGALGRQLQVLIPEQNSLIPWYMLSRKDVRAHYQPHLERLADFLESGEGVWWKKTESGIEFLDGPQEEDFKSSPPLHHFRSQTYKEEQKYLHNKWDVCVDKAKKKQLVLPHMQIKLYEGGSMVRVESGLFPVHVSGQEDICPSDEETPDNLTPEEEQPDNREAGHQAPCISNSDEETSDNLTPEEEQPDNREGGHPAPCISNSDNSDEETSDNLTLEEEQPDNREGGHPAPCISNSDNYDEEDYSKDDDKSVEFIKLQVTSAIDEEQPDYRPTSHYKTTLCQNLQGILGVNSSLTDLDRTRQNFKLRPSLKEEYNQKLAIVQSSVLRQYGELKEAIQAWETDFFISNNREPSYEDAREQHVDNLFKKRKLAAQFLQHWGMSALK